jgi:mRNA interferase MazF
VTRGDVFEVRLAKGHGSEQRGPRFAVIVQTDELAVLSTVVVVPTSRSAAATVFRPEIEVAGQTTRALVEQLRVVDAQRLGRRIGHLTYEEMRSFDDALEMVLGL